MSGHGFPNLRFKQRLLYKPHLHAMPRLTSTRYDTTPQGPIFQNPPSNAMIGSSNPSLRALSRKGLEENQDWQSYS